ncbi:MAG TPA: hypothetical protein VEW66_06475, partial [Thermomicrobiales bacterium]|nr:hypothetical protein [Thermomicrobiales bacterium]
FGWKSITPIDSVVSDILAHRTFASLQFSIVTGASASPSISSRRHLVWPVETPHRSVPSPDIGARRAKLLHPAGRWHVVYT